jgi:hypothetical protein
MILDHRTPHSSFLCLRIADRALQPAPLTRDSNRSEHLNAKAGEIMGTEMKVIQDREIGSLWKGNWCVGDERRIIKELIRKLVEERTFQVGFEDALQAFGISKEEYKKL